MPYGLEAGKVARLEFEADILEMPDGRCIKQFVSALAAYLRLGFNADHIGSAGHQMLDSPDFCGLSAERAFFGGDLHGFFLTRKSIQRSGSGL